MTGDSVSRYSFDAPAGAEYVVYLEALEGVVQVYVIDSTHQHTVAFVSAAPGSPPLYSNPTANFQTIQGGVYLLRVFAFPSGAVARFRFVVSRINTDPEKVPMRFAVGDTVSGETIEPMVDGDEFLAAGDAGQEFVVVLQVPGPAGSGAVGLVVIDPVTDDLFGLAAANAGSASPVTTGRIRFPGSHDYRFIFRSIVSNAYPRYSGPYRFWSYLIDRAPEHRNAAVPLDTEIRGEGIDQAGDVDEFTFNAPAGGQYNVFLQAPRAFQLEVAPLTGLPIAAVAAEPTDTGLFAHATGRFQTPQAGTYVVRVMGSAPNDVADTGAYRLFIYAIDPRPEHVPASITPGDSVEGESIDRPGDVDEFTFSATAGQEFNAFLQGRNGSAETSLQLSVIDPAGTLQRIAQSTGADTSLLEQVTGRFALASAGTYRLRVTGAQSLNDRDTGAYRLLLYRVDRRPESVPVTLTLGDSSSGERIDVPGDVDEYRVVVQDTSGLNLVAQLDDQPREGTPVTVQLLTSGGTQVTGLFANTVPTEAGRIRIVPGTYTLRVDVTHWQDKPTFRGTYRLWLYRFAYAPELVSDTVAIGDTVSGEVIHPWGDVDRFHFYGLRRQHINIALQGRADTSGGGFQAWISGPGGEPIWTFASVSSAASDPTLREHQTMRLDLPVTGWYHVEMTGFGPTRGAYRLLIEPLSASPEQAGSALAPGDSVTTESIDTPGDWDEFTLTATPGQELNVIFQGDPAMNGYAQIRVYDRASGDSLAGNVGQGKRIVGPFRVPASGQVTIAVYQDAGFVRFCYDATCAGIFGLVGPYAFHVNRLNRGPETVPTAYAISDTVRGEAVDPTGDIDEFTASGTPGEVLTPLLRLTADPVPQEGLIMLEVVDPSTGANLAGGGWALFRATTEFLSPGPFTVPPGGAFIVRVKGYGSWGTGIATAPYEMSVKR